MILHHVLCADNRWLFGLFHLALLFPYSLYIFMTSHDQALYSNVLCILMTLPNIIILMILNICWISATLNTGLNHINDWLACNKLSLNVDKKNLKWKDHLNSVSCKMSRTIGVLNILKSRFPTYTLATIYDTLILPHLNYCLLSCSHLLFGLQKKALRLLTCSHI